MVKPAWVLTLGTLGWTAGGNAPKGQEGQTPLSSPEQGGPAPLSTQVLGPHSPRTNTSPNSLGLGDSKKVPSSHLSVPQRTGARVYAMPPVHRPLPVPGRSLWSWGLCPLCRWILEPEAQQPRAGCPQLWWPGVPRGPGWLRTRYQQSRIPSGSPRGLRHSPSSSQRPPALHGVCLLPSLPVTAAKTLSASRL